MFLIGSYVNNTLHYKQIDDGKEVENDFKFVFGNDVGIGLGAVFLINNKVQLGGGYNIGIKSNFSMINLSYFFGN